MKEEDGSREIYVKGRHRKEDRHRGDQIPAPSHFADQNQADNDETLNDRYSGQHPFHRGSH